MSGYKPVFPNEDVYEAAMAADKFRDPASPGFRGSASTQGKPRASFRSSVALIPTPGVHSQRPPKYEPWLLKLWVVITGSMLMMGIAIALEVALQISQDRGGIAVPQKNVFSFASTQFLTSFFPTLLMIPLVYLIQTCDWNVRWWQPYVLLSTGNRLAEETLLLDYVPLDRVSILLKAFKFKHVLIIFSTFTALGAYVLQPLAGSLFSIRQLPSTHDSTADSIRVIGLSPDLGDLNAFASSAGFAEAAGDYIHEPPFIHAGWATAEFVFPANNYLNGSVAVNTTAIQTDVHCANPISTTVNTNVATNFSISGVSVDGCAGGPAFFDPDNAAQQYGVLNVPNCGSNAPANASFEPVMFWYYHVKADGTHEGRTVFCTPQLQLFDVMAYADLSSGALTGVQTLDNYPKPNNVSGTPLNGNVFNGLIFAQSSDTNIQARATSIKSGIPNAIFRGASQNSSGLQAVFDDQDAFTNLTTTVYTQYLALAAKSIYFLPADNQVFSRVTQLVPRLWIEYVLLSPSSRISRPKLIKPTTHLPRPLTTHFLAAILILESLTILYIHILHHRARRLVYLSHAPGSIGTVLSQTAHSGFGELLLPYDDAARMKRKLKGLRFRLDQRTGAIVVDDQVMQYAPGQEPRPHDETMMKLVGQQRAGVGAGASTSNEDYKGDGAEVEYHPVPPAGDMHVPSLQYAPGTKFDGNQRPYADA
ncbi:hypothetical protein EVG20_g6049 [Dentipellis fragilis]|uniref:Uncharacterized protein n=1 Tax=Dentipellis fragilis TaxID=205917 RepID=A0A4Y9YR00_9AGAM|nr:hypothetical protein EVG20_g6049 [Dentipellis fragilis]